GAGGLLVSALAVVAVAVGAAPPVAVVAAPADVEAPAAVVAATVVAFPLLLLLSLPQAATAIIAPEATIADNQRDARMTPPSERLPSAPRHHASARRGHNRRRTHFSASAPP